MFYGQNCFEADKAKGPKRTDQSVCDSWKKCPLCCAHYPFNPKKPHKCYHVSCTNCGEFKHVNHRCYIQPIVEKEPQEQELQDPLEEPLQWQCEDDDNENENSGPPPRPILAFADIECALSEDRVFVPNLICWSSEEDADEVHHSDSKEEFLEALQALTEVEIDARGRNTMVGCQGKCSHKQSWVT